MLAYLPGPAALVAVALTWAVGAVLALGGGALGRGRLPLETGIVAGWGALCLVLTVWGVFLPVSLRAPAIALVAAAVVGGLAVPGWRLPRAEWASAGRAMLLALPLWLVMAPIRPSQPDTFLNLLPNAMYLVDYGRFPTSALPPSHSFLPAAPYDTQFLAFLGALADPRYPAAGMSLINVLLSVVAGLALARAVRGEGRTGPLPWGAVALGLLLAVLLNPGFVPRIDFAAYGETALMVTALLAALAVLRGQYGALALILAAMINAKQSGIGLVAAVFGAAAVAMWAEHGLRWRRLWPLALAGVPAAALYAVWRYHVAHAGVTELTTLPFAEWNWAVLPQTLRSIAEEIAEKPVYFGFVAIALAAFPWCRRRRGWTGATRALAFHAALFVLYNFFLLLAYVAQFSAEMSASAHSFFRYNTHLSLVLVLSLALTVCELGLWKRAARQGRRAAIAAVAVVLLAPIGFAARLRFDLAMPQPLVWDLAREVKPHLGDDDRVALLLPGDNDSVAWVLAGLLRDVPPRRPRLDLLPRNTAGPAALDEAARLGYAKALVSCNGAGSAELLEHDAAGWKTVATWPYPPDAAHQRWQHILAWEPFCRRN